MICGQIMRTKFPKATTEMTILESITIMNENRVRHLPVCDEEDYLIGLVSESDIRKLLAKKEGNIDIVHTAIKTIMKTEIIAGHPMDFVEDIAFMLYELKISCLPMVQDGRLIGMVTETDLLRTLTELTGSTMPSSQIEIRIKNKLGTFGEIADIITKRNTTIQNLLIYPDKDYPEYQIMMLRVQLMNPAPLVEDLKNHHYDVIWPKQVGLFI